MRLVVPSWIGLYLFIKGHLITLTVPLNHRSVQYIQFTARGNILFSAVDDLVNDEKWIYSPPISIEYRCALELKTERIEPKAEPMKGF